jgi:hypothetical protein
MTFDIFGRQEYELDDLEIWEQKPVEIKVGKTHFLIRLLPVDDYFQFSNDFVKLLASFQTDFAKLPFLSGKEWNDAGIVEKVSATLSGIMSNKKLREMFKRICFKYFSPVKKKGDGIFGRTFFYFLNRRNEKKFRREIGKELTVDHLCQAFLFAYKINIDGVKKNFQFLLKSIQSSQSPYFMAIFNANMDGANKLFDKLQL